MEAADRAFRELGGERRETFSAETRRQCRLQSMRALASVHGVLDSTPALSTSTQRETEKDSKGR